MAILSVYYKNNRMKVSLLGIHLASIELKNSSGDFKNDNIIIDEKLEYICALLKNKFRITDVPQACGNRELVQKASLSILSKFSDIMKRNGIKWWLDSGTLIGYIIPDNMKKELKREKRNSDLKNTVIELLSNATVGSAIGAILSKL